MKDLVLDSSKMLYLHIPFCRSKCPYCAFFSTACHDDRLIDEYADAMLRQIYAYETRDILSSIYFGGGSPFLLGFERISSVFEAIKTKFDIADDAEITIELNPADFRDINAKDVLCQLSVLGFNRISLGLQTTCDNLLKKLGRRHYHGEFHEIYTLTREYFQNVSVDLMFALPTQKVEQIIIDLDYVISISPEHISVYSMIIEPNTPFFERSRQLELPDEESEEAMYDLICGKLRQAGYLHYEISAFAKRGFESRHNSGYWKMREYIAIGAASHGFLNRKRYKNIDNIREYINRADDKHFSPTDYDSAISMTDNEFENDKIMLGLRLSEGLEIPTGKDDYVAEFVKNKLAMIKGNRFNLTERGFRISNHIIGNLLK